MTWKPTDEMVHAFQGADLDSRTTGEAWVREILIAVQPLIAAEARVKALGEADDIIKAISADWEADGEIGKRDAADYLSRVIRCRSLIPKPAEDKP